MVTEGMIGFERELQSNRIRVWVENEKGSRLSESLVIPVSEFQKVLADCGAVDEGTIRWFSGDAQMGVVRLKNFDNVTRSLGIDGSR